MIEKCPYCKGMISERKGKYFDRAKANHLADCPARPKKEEEK